MLNGYNGTILAYGQTGSGKTYTMFGSDIYDDKYKGIIPRVAMDIFKVWEFNPDVKEFLVSCSMLEIYKENLRDLLTDDVEELKIKESPQRGIHVEGLSEMPIGSEDELMYWIEQGEGRRVWAETRQNFISSRSHALFILEVKQVLANDSETRGILNLVDLAGCEKVGKSGAHGQIFEEGTKINLSLSALGNVIHALTVGSDHVPYRDSKLTRLLQESLGGNYKTTLIVTCSPHSSQLNETQSTLKFAQRAKKIKNRVQVNVKSSPDQLLKIIEQLKGELREKTVQIERFIGGHFGSGNLMTGTSGADHGCSPAPKMIPRVATQMKEYVLPLAQIEEHDGPGTSKNIGKSSLSICDGNESGIKDEPSMGYDSAVEAKLIEAERTNSRLMNSLKETRAKMEVLGKENTDLEQKLRLTEIKLLEEKKHVLILEDKLKKAEIALAEQRHDELKQTLGSHLEALQVSSYQSQIKALTEALDDSETECFKLMKEKKTKLKADSVHFFSLSVPDYVSAKRSAGEGKCSELMINPAKMFMNKVVVPLEETKLLETSKYSTELYNAVEDKKVNPETVAYLLKNQLVEAGITNHNLKRVISLLLWKLSIQHATNSVKGEMGASLQKTIDSLEGLLRENSARSELWKRKLEKLEFDLAQIQLQVQRGGARANKGLSGSVLIPRPRIKKPINKKNFRKQDSDENQKEIGSDSARHLREIPKRLLSNQGGDFTQLSTFGRELDNFGASETPAFTKQCSWNAKLRAENRASKIGTETVTKEAYHELEETLKEAQIEQRWNKTLSDLLMEELLKCREQIKGLSEQIAKIEKSAEDAIKDESENWSRVTNILKANFVESGREMIA